EFVGDQAYAAPVRVYWIVNCGQRALVVRGMAVAIVNHGGGIVDMGGAHLEARVQANHLDYLTKNMARSGLGFRSWRLRRGRCRSCQRPEKGQQQQAQY